MSEAVTQSEVEDVLSSVRRLVGDTHYQKKKPVAHLFDPSAKLVLTPQLRVAPAEAADVLRLTPDNAVQVSSGWPATCST